jgi:hypothetical protein
MEVNKKVHKDGTVQPREMKIAKCDTQPALNAHEVKLKVIPVDPRLIYISPPRADKINFY